MQWIKKGLLFNVENISDWANSHCHKPTPLILDDNTLRVYFGVRDRNSKTRTTFVDIDIQNIDDFKVKYFHDKPVIDLGKIGAFDDSGANVCSILRVNNSIYMYYIGWNPSTTVHTRNAIGVVVSDDNGMTFRRLYDGPILDRNKEEPYYTGAVDVIKQGDLWKMYYTSGSEWKMINGKPEIKYHIKYATSHNGIDWTRNNIDCILPNYDMEAVARPSVIYDQGIYKMWFSKRNINGFRLNSEKNYRGGYAESDDGKRWIRKDELFGLHLSENGWDSEAIAYPYVFKIKNRFVMLYNGNGFGKSGFGYAVLG
ncbi:hypothetical protein [Bacillus sp. FJAT-49736]|uniref:hypothetical protein n=1 Tax=Bacillus sp. FJAT-49736 TaxID=2833582 RepID=UPI001BCA2F06|nr:hypothetical protein [Bacillus sp. FJAT-49736]MBS4174152.1 hypothetical protein [Bacillus sp. FJAT-49736]